MITINEEKCKRPLAISGGNPIRTVPLPWEFPGAYYINEEESQLIQTVIHHKSPFRYYGIDLQHMVDQLETAVCEKFSVPYAIAVNSGTSALYIALAAFGVGPSDEVLVPGYLWVSCVSAIVRLGAIPRLVDIDDTFCMDPEDLKNKISTHSKAIIFVHMSGATGHINEVKKIAQENQLFLLEDCAQSLGTTLNRQYVGTFGDMAIFSFQLNKNITSGEGGMIICRDKQLYQRCFACHDLGFSRTPSGRLDFSDTHCQLWGSGSRMSELTAAMALAQFKKLDKILHAMRESKSKIRQSLIHLEKLQFRRILDPLGDSSCFLITIYPSVELCQAFTLALVAEGIKGEKGSITCVPMSQWGLHWYFNIPSLVNKTSWCADGFPWSHPKNNFANLYTYAKGSLPCCDDYADRAALLTISSHLSDQDIIDIITAFHKVYFHLLKNTKDA